MAGEGVQTCLPPGSTTMGIATSGYATAWMLLILAGVANIAGYAFDLYQPFWWFDRVLHGSEALASPGINYIKWPAPVRPGDTLQLRVEVIEARRSRSNPQRGVLRARWRLANQQDVEVLDLEATTLFGLKD